MVKNSKDVTKYIKQPYPVSEVRGNFTLQQTHILIEMMDQLQSRIEQRMSQGQLSLFEDDEFDGNGRIHIDVKFSDIASRPDYYKEVEMLANKMMQMYVKNETEENGDSFVELEHFVSAVKYSKQGNRRNYIRFSFDKVQAMQLFNMARYSRYLKAVAKGAKNRYTARLYMLMTSTRQFGVYKIKYAELRKILGCDEYDEKGKTFVVKKYPLYKSFKMAVLKTAEKELKELAEAGMSDCWFETIEHLPKGKNSGAPETLEFIIHTTEMGEIEDAKAMSNKSMIEIERILKDDYGVPVKDIRKLLNTVVAENADMLLQRLNEIGISMTDKDIKSRKHYVLTSLKNAIADAKATTKANALETVAPHTTAETEVKVVDKSMAEHRAEWGSVVEMLGDWADGVKLIEWGNESVTVGMSPAFAQTYLATFGKDIVVLLKENTGKNVVVINSTV